MSTIKAKCHSNRTSIQLEEGKRYRFKASGHWKDAWEQCPATGYTSMMLWPFEMLRREPRAKWFSAIGRIDDKPNTQFDIGDLIETDGIYTATETGTLYCFANDVWFMYWNNTGEIELDAQRVEDTEDQ